MVNKLVEDITRSSDDEIRRKREVVLDFINKQEKDATERKKEDRSGGFSFARLVDSLAARREEKIAAQAGVSVKPEKSRPIEIDLIPKNYIEYRRLDDIRKPEGGSGGEAGPEIATGSKTEAERTEAERLAADRKAAEEKEKREFLEKSRLEAEAAGLKAREEAARLKAAKEKERRESEEKAKQEAEAARVRAAEAERKRKEEQAEARRREIEQLEKRRQEAERQKRERAEQKRAAKLKARQDFRRRASESLMNLKAQLLPVGLRRYFSLPASVFTFLATVYVLFSLVLYTFEIDGPTVRFVTRIVPVPALITNEGIVNYYDYLDAKKSESEKLAGQISNSITDKIIAGITRTEVLKTKIINSLAADYGFAAAASYAAARDKTFLDRLAIAVALDPGLNRTPLSEARQFKRSLLGGSDFFAQARAADLEINTEYLPLRSAIDKFGSNVTLLTQNEVSRIIVRPDGYYIVKFFNAANDLYGYKYVFIAARTLDNLINERLKTAKVIILVN